MLALAPSASAEQKKQLGSWDVHYIVLNSTFLSPQVAKQYNIVRSRYNGLINISVLDSKNGAAQNVVVRGEARNLLGVLKPLGFTQVQEGQAIYYLSTLSFSDQEQYRFTVTISDGRNEETLKFQHKFYVD